MGRAALTPSSMGRCRAGSRVEPVTTLLSAAEAVRKVEAAAPTEEATVVVEGSVLLNALAVEAAEGASLTRGRKLITRRNIWLMLVGDKIVSLFGFLAWVLLGSALCSAQPTPDRSTIKPARVWFDLAQRGKSPALLQGALTLRSVPPDEQTITVEVVPGLVPFVDLPPDSQWAVSGEIAGYWVRREPLTAGAAGSESRLALVTWPLGRVMGTLQPADSKFRLPKEIAVTTIKSPDPNRKSQAPPGHLVCPVDEQGRWSCELPEETFDLTITARGFVPHYRLNVAIRAAKTTDLGKLKLAKGASLAGWIVVEGGALDPKTCLTRLVPLVATGSGGAQKAQLEAAAMERRAHPGGLFQFAGVSPGAYRLEVSQPGFATAQVFPLELWEERETFLERPVIVRRPLTLEVAVSPPRDWLDRPWRVLVQRSSDFSAGMEKGPAFNGPVDANGEARATGQAPGDFSISVLDSLGNQMYSAHDVGMRDPNDARHEVTIEVITVQGTLRLGRDPIAATLWFGGRSGSRAIQMVAGAEGKFHGVLPKEGIWLVEVSASEPRLEAVAKAKVEADRAGRANVEIRLPNTRVFGKVVRDDGLPVTRAGVALSGESGSLYVDAAEDGSFELRGAPSGLAQLVGSARKAGERWASSAHWVSLAEDQDVGPVELRLSKMRRLAGKVIANTGPVVGAGVEVRSADLLYGDSTRTGLTGEFSVHLPSQAQRLVGVISPPGYALSTFELIGSDEPAVLPVSRDGGVLEVTQPLSNDQYLEKDLVLWIFHEGRPLPMGALARWAQGHGEPLYEAGSKRFRVSAVAAGEYRACIVARSALLAQSNASKTCASGHLSSGSTLRLSVPPPP